MVLNFLFPIMLLEGNPMFKTGLYNPCFFSVCVCLHIISQTVTVSLITLWVSHLLSTKEQLVIVLVYFLPTLLNTHILPLCPPFSSSPTHKYYFFTLTINFLPTLFSVTLLSGETAGGFKHGRDRRGGVRSAVAHPGGSALLPQ